MSQIRLDVDVEDALRAILATDGGSLAVAANRVLRRSLGLTAGSPRIPVVPGKATIVASRGRRTRCAHPLARREPGNRCGACGANLPTGR